MATKNYQIWSHSFLSCFLLFIVIVLANVTLARTSVRMDLTEEGLYTLADGSKRILRRMDDPVTITVYWGGVPKQAESARRQIAGLLEEMHGVAGDKLTVTWVDTETEDGRKEADAKSDAKIINKFVFGSSEGSKQVQSEGYMSLILESGAEKPFPLDLLTRHTAQFEYLMIAEINRRSRVEAPAVGLYIADSPRWMQQDGGKGRPGRFNTLQIEFKRAFGKHLVEVPSLEKPVAADVQVLVVAAPWRLSAASAYYLEQFGLRGGRIILLMDPVNFENAVLPSPDREPHSSGLEDWLAHLGVTVEYGLVGDFKQGFQAKNLFHRGEQGPYAYWPLIRNENMDGSHPLFSMLPTIPTMFPSAITVDDAKQAGAGREVTVLARTSEMGFRRAEIGEVHDTLDHPTPAASKLESIPVIVHLKGPLVSKWKGQDRPKTPAEIAAEAAKKAEEEKKAKEDAEREGAGDGEPPPDDAPVPVPAPEDDPGKDDKPADPEQPDKPGGDGGEGGDGEAEGSDEPPRLDSGTINIVIAGDAEMCADYTDIEIRDPFTGRRGTINGRGGFATALGLAEWLTGSEDLIELRTRNTNARQLEPVDESEKQAIQWLNVGGIPFLLLCLGIVVFAVRRSQRS